MVTLANTKSGIRKLIEAEVNAAKIIENATIQANIFDGDVHDFHNSEASYDQINKLNQYLELSCFYEQLESLDLNTDEAIVVFSIRFKYEPEGFYSRDDLITILGIKDPFKGEVIFDLDNNEVRAGSFKITLDEAISKLAYEFQENINNYTYLYISKYKVEITNIHVAVSTLQTNYINASISASGDAQIIINQSNEMEKNIILLLKEAGGENEVEEIEEEMEEEEEVKEEKKDIDIVFIVLMIIGILLIIAILAMIIVRPTFSAVINSNS